MDVYRNSCYRKVDFKINENQTVKEAITRYNAFDIGCLAVMDDTNNLVGVCSERDFISKVAAKNMDSTDVKIGDICTRTLVIARANDSIHDCMNKMLIRKIRHLVIMDNKLVDCIGMISIRDLIKVVNYEGNVENRFAIRNVPQILCRNSSVKRGIPTENDNQEPITRFIYFG